MSRVALLKYVKKQKEETLYTTNSIPRGGTTLQPAFPVLECQNVVLDASPVALEDAGMPARRNARMLECWNAGMPGMLECWNARNARRNARNNARKMQQLFFLFFINNATPTHNMISIIIKEE